MRGRDGRRGVRVSPPLPMDTKIIDMRPSLGDDVGAQRRAAGRRPDASVEDRVLSAAISILLDSGVRDCTVHEVARRSGVARATIFRRWRTRDALLAAAMRAMVVRSEPLPDTGRVIDDLTELLRRRADTYAGDRGRRIAEFALAVLARAHDEPDTAAIVDAVAGTQRAEFSAVLARARDRGEIAADADTETVIDALYGCMWSQVLRLRPVDPADAAKWVRTVMCGVLTN